jgi:MFS family permease
VRAAVGVHPEGPPRGFLQLLRDPVVGPFTFGKLLSSSGIWAHNIVAAIVVFELTGSATLVGAVTAAQFIPQLLLTPWSGARADRADKRLQLVTGRLITATGSAALVVWSLTVGLRGTEGAVVVICAAFLVGVGFAVGGPAMESLVPSLVRPSELASAVALNTLPVTLARSLGPALGALLVLAQGPELAFGVAALGHVVFAVVIVRRVPPTPLTPPRDTSMRAGFRHVRADRPVAALLVGITAVGIGADPIVTLGPTIAASLDSGQQLVGALGSGFGIGSALAFVVLGPLRRRLGSPRLGCTGLVVMATGLAGVATVWHPAVAVGSMVVAGVGMTLALTSLTTLIQRRAPDDLRGRIMALWALAFLGTRPLAATVNGAVADLTDVTTALLVVVVLLLAGAWTARPSRVAPALAPALDRPARALPLGALEEDMRPETARLHDELVEGAATAGTAPTDLPEPRPSLPAAGRDGARAHRCDTP